MTVCHRENVGIQVLGTGVAHDNIGHQLSFDLSQHIGAHQSIEVVEAVAALQLDHLDREDEIKGRAQHAARHFLFREAANPEIDAAVVGVAAGHKRCIVDRCAGSRTQGCRVCRRIACL